MRPRKPVTGEIRFISLSWLSGISISGPIISDGCVGLAVPDMVLIDAVGVRFSAT
jgi:hypothetical protein